MHGSYAYIFNCTVQESSSSLLSLSVLFIKKAYMTLSISWCRRNWMIFNHSHTWTHMHTHKHTHTHTAWKTCFVLDANMELRFFGDFDRKSDDMFAGAGEGRPGQGSQLPLPPKMDPRSEIAYRAYENQRIMLHDKTWFLTFDRCWKICAPERLRCFTKFDEKNVSTFMSFVFL